MQTQEKSNPWVDMGDVSDYFTIREGFLLFLCRKDLKGVKVIGLRSAGGKWFKYSSSIPWSWEMGAGQWFPAHSLFYYRYSVDKQPVSKEEVTAILLMGHPLDTDHD